MQAGCSFRWINVLMKSVAVFVGLPLMGCLVVWGDAKGEERVARSYYQDSTWKPRPILPADDALRGDFWPASPKVEVDYQDPGFNEERLSRVPAPGVHPRVLLTPSDVESIRAKIALGDKAPQPFRVMWQRTQKSRSAFYALVAKDDTLGKQLAAELVTKIRTLEPKIEKLNARLDHDNLWSAERSTVASGDPNPPTEIWDLLDYDYLHGWMTPDERELARRVIAKICDHRITNYMIMPDHYMINNHEGFGLEYVRLQLLIEGEKGFDKDVYALTVHKARAMLDWYLDRDGMCYESIKGWLNISAFVAIGLRERDLLRHGHLRAKMRFFQAASRWENDAWQIRDEMRASAFHVIWMMHYYHPKDEGIDYLYQASLASSPFVMDAEAKWPNPVGIVSELLLLYADQGLTGADGKALDYSDQKRIDALKFPLTWHDDARGYVEARNTWRKDDLHVGFTCKQDFFYGGHEGSENNRIILWHGGVNWVRDLNMLAVKATFLQNMLTVDGKGLTWPPVPGVWLGIHDSPEGVVAAGDGKMGYSFSKVMQVHPLDSPSIQLPYYAPFAEGNYDLIRDQQVAFHPGTVKWTDGYAHTDYGPWSGETRMVEGYKPSNPMNQAYRTVHLARGENPYVLVIDDARKDGLKHLFEWNISLPEDVELLDSKSPEIAFQAVDAKPERESDLLLTRPNTPRDPKTGKLLVNKGDPLFLVRVLWRNSPNGFPVPRFERYHGTPEKPYQRFSHLTVPAYSESPEFRILLYPHRLGDPLPETKWNQNRTELTVKIKQQTDTYHFAQTDGGRTVLTMERGGKTVLTSDAPPARPTVTVRGRVFDMNEARTTRRENEPASYLVDESVEVSLSRVSPPAEVRYTLDGSEPTANSTLFEAPFLVKKTCELKACIVDSSWTAGPRQSRPLVARFTVRAAKPGLAEPPPSSRPGLLARVYELKTVLWNDHGFFEAKKIMMPEVSREKPLATAAAPGFFLPHAVPAAPQIQQRKAFYRFNGWFQAPGRGVYEFAVNSCGPVTLDVAGQAAIEETGVFHQQQTLRRGEVVLDRGWHPFELVVCDPLFWNISSLDLMPFEVTARVNGGAFRPIEASSLRFVADGLTPGSLSPEPQWHEAVKDLPRLEPGLELNIVDRSGKRRDANYFDVDGLEPFRSEQVDEIEANSNPGQVRVYNGYFHATTAGVYTFNLPARNGESAGLGALQATCQNQLKIGDEVVVQRGLQGRNPTRQVALKEGWHPISIRYGLTTGLPTVTYPNGEEVRLNASRLSRPVLVSIRPEAEPLQRRAYEIFGSTSVVFRLPGAEKTEIRYTVDGQNPTASSPVATGPLNVDKTTTLMATAFQNGRPVTAPAKVEFQRVDVPVAQMLGFIRFSEVAGKTGSVENCQPLKLWIDGDAKAAEGRGGKVLFVNSSGAPDPSKPKREANLSHAGGKTGFKIGGIQMRETALTVALWFKTPVATGKLFGKEGYTAFGKSYKTVSCAFNNGQLRAGPGRASGGKLVADAWQHVVLSADETAVTLYLNGEKVAEEPGSRDLTTDTLDFFAETPALVESVRLYNRALPIAQVKQLYTWENEHASPATR
jgi:hypothetical protein